MLFKETQAKVLIPRKRLHMYVRRWRLALSVFELCQNLPNQACVLLVPLGVLSSRFQASAVSQFECLYDHWCAQNERM